MNQPDDPSSMSLHCMARLSRRLTMCFVMGWMLLTMSGCGSSNQRVSTENDSLRRDNLELKREIDRLHGSVKAQADKLQSLESSKTPPADPDAQIPQVTYVKFGRYSTALDQNNDGHDDIIRLYVLTLDQRKRFLPIAGQVVAQVDHVVAGQNPVTLATQQFDAKAVDAAYRSQFTGTHYTFDIPLPKGDAIKNIKQLTVSLQLTDLQVGTKFNEQIVLPLKP
tara:strand:+ start:281 stop:949 length:669 start_codon:yes stop_codon:yes gene_type:complete